MAETAATTSLRIFSLIWPLRGSGVRPALLPPLVAARPATAGMAGAGTWMVSVAISEAAEHWVVDDERRGDTVGFDCTGQDRRRHSSCLKIGGPAAELAPSRSPGRTEQGELEKSARAGNLWGPKCA